MLTPQKSAPANNTWFIRIPSGDGELFGRIEVSNQEITAHHLRLVRQFLALAIEDLESASSLSLSPRHGVKQMTDTHDPKSSSSQSLLAITAERLESINYTPRDTFVAARACRIVQRLAEIDDDPGRVRFAADDLLTELWRLARQLSGKLE